MASFFTRLLPDNTDLWREFLDLVRQFRPTIMDYSQYHIILTTSGDEVWLMFDRPGGKIIGTGTLHFQRKFIHNRAVVGRIEDVIIHKDYRGSGYGKKLIQHLIQQAKQTCYKVVDCTTDLASFYQHCGMTKSGNIQMEVRFA